MREKRGKVQRRRRGKEEVTKRNKRDSKEGRV